MQYKPYLFCLLALISIISIDSMAASASNELHTPLANGWYGEIAGGVSTMLNKNYPSAINHASRLGKRLSLGYKFMPYLAGEVGYLRYGRVRIIVPNTGRQAGEDKHNAIYFAAKGIYPIYNSGFELFGKLGFQRMQSEVDITRPDYNTINLTANEHYAKGPYLGLGASYAFFPEFLGSLEWSRAFGNKNTGDMDLYGVAFSFIIN